VSPHPPCARRSRPRLSTSAERCARSPRRVGGRRNEAPSRQQDLDRRHLRGDCEDGQPDARRVTGRHEMSGPHWRKSSTCPVSMHNGMQVRELPPGTLSAAFIGVTIKDRKERRRSSPMNPGVPTRPSSPDDAGVALLPNVVQELHRMTACLDALLEAAARTRRQVTTAMARVRREERLADSDGALRWTSSRPENGSTDPARR
jgi:hypothetical protein